jgi:hypothetical protein
MIRKEPNIRSAKPLRAIGFLVVCAWSLVTWLLNPYLPNDAARFAFSIWGAIISGAGVILAVYCLWRRKEV